MVNFSYKLLCVSILLCTHIWAYGQDLKSVNFIGYKKECPVFASYKDGYRDLYFLCEKDDNFELMEKNKLQPKYSDYFVGYLYVKNDFKRYTLYHNKIPHSFVFEQNGEIKKHLLDFIPQDEGYDLQGNLCFLSTENDSSTFENYFSDPIKQLSLQTGEVTELPIKGLYPKVVGEYLYYADYHDRNQHDLVYDIYRVKIGQWENVEKLFEKNYMNSWNVTPDGNHLLVEIINKGYKPFPIIYNIQEKKYATINIEDRPSAFFYSFQKNALCFYDVGLKNGKKRFIYYSIPDEFPYTLPE